MNYLVSVKESLRDVYDPFPYRRYHRSNQCIFIHIPKTAGTSILTALGANPSRRDHLSYKIYEKANEVRFNAYFKFCFVRNPWDRIHSVYKYISNGGNGKKDLKLKSLIEDYCDNFEGFVMDFLNWEMLYSHNMFKPQTFFIFDVFNNSMVDYIGKFESLDRDMKYVLDKLGINSTLQVINKSAGVEYRKAYRTDEMVSKIQELYHSDVRNFSYKF